MDIVYEVEKEGGSRQQRFVSFDAMMDATPTHSAQVTERNVEKGSNIADHVVAAQAHLAFSAYITNAPIAVPDTEDDSITGDVRSLELKLPEPKTPSFALVQPRMPRMASVLQFDQQFDRCKTVYTQLVDIVENGRLVSITVDRLPAFNDMVLVNLSAPIVVDDGDAIRFTFEAVKIRFVDSQLSKEIIFDPEVITLKRNRGHQPAQPATAQEKSAAAAFFDRLDGGKK